MSSELKLFSIRILKFKPCIFFSGIFDNQKFGCFFYFFLICFVIFAVSNLLVFLPKLFSSSIFFFLNANIYLCFLKVDPYSCNF